MRANIIVRPQTRRSLRCLAAFNFRTGTSSQGNLNPNNDTSTDEVVGPDAYKVAVVVSIGAAIFSLCL
jgi:hypothetical protein